MFELRDLETLPATDRAGPCVSLYMPTHRQHPDALTNGVALDRMPTARGLAAIYRF